MFPYARRFAVVCGGGSNGGDGRIAARVLREAGREAVETDAVEGCDVVIDALFGTGFHGAPRPEAAALIERINALRRPSSRSTCPPASTPRPGRSPARPSTPRSTVTFHASKVGARRRAGPLPRRGRRRRRHRARRRRDRGSPRHAGAAAAGAAARARATRSSPPAPCSSSAAAPGTTGRAGAERRWRRCAPTPAT